jgi:hypothetical protein
LYDKTKDMKRIGIILSSVALLMPESEINKLNSAEIVSLMSEQYPLSLCAALVILREGISKYYNSVLGLIRSNTNEAKLSDIKSILD